MRRVLALTGLLLGLGCVAGCGSATNEQPGQTSPPDAVGRRVAIYLVRDGKVAPVRRVTNRELDPLEDTIALLLRGPTLEEQRDGYATSVHVGHLAEFSVADGTVAVEPKADRRISDIGAAQIFHTLIQFRDVMHVVVAGNELTAASVETQTPQIVVELPLPGDTVHSPIRLRGTANVFEANVSIEVRDASGKVILQTFTTATSGTGTRGTFDTTLSLPGVTGRVTIVAFEASAEDGRPLHVVEVPVTVGP